MGLHVKVIERRRLLQDLGETSHAPMMPSGIDMGNDVELNIGAEHQIIIPDRGLALLTEASVGELC